MAKIAEIKRVQEILLQRVHIRHQQTGYKLHRCSVIELLWYYACMQIAEIGIYKGKTARAVLKSCSDLLDRYWLVDPWLPMGKSTDAGFLDPNADWKALYAAACKMADESKGVAEVLHMTSADAASLFASASLDFVFLDARHTYEPIRQDIDLWLPKLTPTGVLAGHDYYKKRWGVKRAVDEVFGESVGHLPDSVWFVDLRWQTR